MQGTWSSPVADSEGVFGRGLSMAREEAWMSCKESFGLVCESIDTKAHAELGVRGCSVSCL
jgi:hypothetical protein